MLLRHNFLRELHRGFTMIELLVVVAILGILLTLIFVNVPLYISRGNDAERKSDLAAYKIVFEHYYEDYHCYPDMATVQDCGSTTTKLQPYLQKILCDPATHKPYQYEVLGSVNCPTAYRIFTELADAKDKSIAEVGCTAGCGPASTTTYNYGVASTNTIVGSPTISQPGNGGSSGGSPGGESTPLNCYTLPCQCVPTSCGSGCLGHQRCSDDSFYCYSTPLCP